MYAELPVVVEPIREPAGDSSGDSCDGYTADDCCGGSDGIQVLQCSWDPACDCPDGTTLAGTDSEGYLLCTCPG